MGAIRGLFVATDSDVDDALGKEMYFGEVLGKHSDISGVLRREALQVMTTERTDAAFIERFEEIGCATGFNPLNHIEESEEAEDNETES